MIIWIIGLSCSGKTAIGKKLHEYLQTGDEHWLFVDGDTFREILGNDLSHSPEDRLKNGKRLSQFSKYLDTQNTNAIVCVLSNYHEIQEWNKKAISDYKEIYVNAEIETLKSRDNKDIYKKALKGEIKNVVGVDIPFIPPKDPTIILYNDLSSNIDELVQRAIHDLNLQTKIKYEYTKDNLFENKEKYEYSTYLGDEFLELYTKDRKNCLNKISNFLKKVEADVLQRQLKGSPHWFIDKYNCNQNFAKVVVDEITLLEEDNECAFSIKKWMLTSLHDVSQINESILFKLIQRFEVSKKIFTHYTREEVRKHSDNCHKLINYLLFSILLYELMTTFNFDEKQKMIFMNSFIKNNDLLISLEKIMFSTAELVLLELVLSKELELFNSLKRKYL